MDSACIPAVSEYLNKNALNRARFYYQLPIMAGPKILPLDSRLLFLYDDFTVV